MKSKIQWTNRVWNPVRGCRRVSPGCENCYAERQAHRFSGPGQPYEALTKPTKGGPVWTGEARFVPEMLDAPLRWKKPQRVFVNSMSDLFHDDITDDQIAAVFGVMAACPQHTFQILTKRPERMLEWFRWISVSLPSCHPYGPARGVRWYAWNEPALKEAITPAYSHDPCWRWPLDNVWVGVSTEDQKRAEERIPMLLECPAATRFVSAEPLLGPLDLFAFLKGELRAACLTELGAAHGVPGLDLVIVGGESGPGARGCDIDWIHSIVDQCRDAGTACFVKQLGASPFYARDAEGGPHGTKDALARFGEEHPQRPWFTDWCLTHTPDGRSRWFKHLRFKDRKGGTMDEWPESLRVRQFPGDL